MNLSHSAFPPHAFAFKGGGGAAPAQQIQSAPVPLPAPPVVNTNAEVIQAQNDFAQRNALRKSVKKTIFAGDTGGYHAAAPGTLPGNRPTLG